MDSIALVTEAFLEIVFLVIVFPVIAFPAIVDFLVEITASLVVTGRKGGRGERGGGEGGGWEGSEDGAWEVEEGEAVASGNENLKEGVEVIKGECT